MLKDASLLYAGLGIPVAFYRILRPPSGWFPLVCMVRGIRVVCGRVVSPHGTSTSRDGGPVPSCGHDWEDPLADAPRVPYIQS